MNWKMAPACALALLGTAGISRADTIDYLQVFTQAGVNCGVGICDGTARYDTLNGGSTETTPSTGATVSTTAPGAWKVATTASGTYKGAPDSVINNLDLSQAAIHELIDSATGGGSIIDTMRDSILFDNTTGSTAYLTVNWSIDGSIQTSSSGFIDVFGDLVFGGEFKYSGHLDYNGNLVDDPSNAGGWTSASYTHATTPFGYNFTGTYALAPGQTTVGFMLKSTLGGGLAKGDFLNTSAVSMVLPTGVTYTSDSGAFLSGPSPSSVPEPSTWALLVPLALISIAMRNRLRRADRV